MNINRKTRPSGDAQEREMDTQKSAGRAALHGVHADFTTTLNGLQGRLALKPKEAAPLIGVGVNAIYQLCHRVDFPAVRVGAGYIIPVDGLRRWLDRQTEGEV